eukprot:CAMPEP_0171473434 /NCGR_PEP_ID=MMETSP0946-20130122/1838_1 /TAXON_ID=109269 /ORGANISM="Vaucheria litorea, Strain CCMP2940" /LENGTH=499 /DNA_ID=CAMNT_0012003195 /DNA_START=12 /DNA_END=1511 /DNA_ORIENTATION=-
MGCNQSNEIETRKNISTSELATESIVKRIKNRKSQNLTQEVYDRDIRTVYEINECGPDLGEGAFAIVREAKHRGNGCHYAVKILKIRGRMTSKMLCELKKEAEIMKMLDHPNIIRLQEVYTSIDKLYLVMDLAKGGDLQQRLFKNRTLFQDESNAQSLVRKICGAIMYCHSKGIIHRDLKLENLLFETEDANSEIKLTDFGLSSLPESDYHSSRGQGTADYMAPEQVRGKVCMASDCWAIGVILYVLLSLQFPFYAATPDGVMLKIKYCKLRFPEKIFGRISHNGKDFMKKLLEKDLSKRMTASEALEHPWLIPVKSEISPISANVLKNMANYPKRLGLHRLALELIAHSLEAEQISNLITEFHKMDIEGNGLIDFYEFTTALNKSGIGTNQAAKIFKVMDAENNGMITYNEFLASALDIRSISENTIKSTFDKIDFSHKGSISVTDLKLVAGTDMTDKQLEETIAEIDTNKTGKISFDSFRAAMRRSSAMIADGEITV